MWNLGLLKKNKAQWTALCHNELSCGLVEEHRRAAVICLGAMAEAWGGYHHSSMQAVYLLGNYWRAEMVNAISGSQYGTKVWVARMANANDFAMNTVLLCNGSEGYESDTWQVNE